jgi:hypothetical protein
VSVFRPKYTVNGEKRISNIWWYKFTFADQVIRESSKSDSKTIAKDAERAHRREMEQAINRIPKRQKTFYFPPQLTYGSRENLDSLKQAGSGTRNAWLFSKRHLANVSFATLMGTM